MTRDELKDLAEKAVRQVCAASPHRADGDNRKRLVMMTRALIAGAMLLVASTPSQPETVNQYITDTSNPDLKEAMEAYAIGVGHGFFWYQAVAGAVNRDPTGQSRLFCLPANTNFSGKIVMDAAKRVTETAKGEDVFERELLSALIKMFPCESRPELK